ncbi:hypothetical protein JM93_01588 [Roseibium hamelinense]|uniref:Uncharacterized protein n=1 Tax=Roseibium hamelinense TaxID=150831 RepID=A0A562T767_9HYPH|nr:hypothetical protein JM93_01588 [Roseibium hamelinense]
MVKKDHDKAMTYAVIYALSKVDLAKLRSTPMFPSSARVERLKAA